MPYYKRGYMPQFQQPYGSPQTDAEIIQAAGVVCGQFNIQLNETGNRFAQAATTLYGPMINAELGSNRWRFAQTSQQVSIWEYIPPELQYNLWSYKTKLPGDLLILTSVFPLQDYAVIGDSIFLMGNSPLRLLYLRYVPVSNWDPAFKWFIIYQLAEHMALSVTSAEKAASITKQRQHWESRALFANAQSTPSSPIAVNPWLAIRLEGGS